MILRSMEGIKREAMALVTGSADHNYNDMVFSDVEEENNFLKLFNIAILTMKKLRSILRCSAFEK